VELFSSVALPPLLYSQAKQSQEETFKTSKAQGQGVGTKSSGLRIELVEETLLQISLAGKQFFEDYWRTANSRII